MHPGGYTERCVTALSLILPVARTLVLALTGTLALEGRLALGLRRLRVLRLRFRLELEVRLVLGRAMGPGLELRLGTRTRAPAPVRIDRTVGVCSIRRARASCANAPTVDENLVAAYRQTVIGDAERRREVVVESDGGVGSIPLGRPLEVESGPWTKGTRGRVSLATEGIATIKVVVSVSLGLLVLLVQLAAARTRLLARIVVAIRLIEWGAFLLTARIGEVIAIGTFISTLRRRLLARIMIVVFAV